MSHTRAQPPVLDGFTLPSLDVYSPMFLIIFVPFFYGAFAFGYFLLRSPQSKMVRVGLGLVLISLALLGISLLTIRGPGAAFGMVGLLFGIILPVFVTGLGLSCGAQSKLYALNGRRNLSRVFFWIPLLIWAGLFIWMYSWAYKINKTRNDARSAYQSLTIEEAFGPHTLSIAISPQIKLVYACHFQRQTKDELKSCHNKAYADDYRLKNQSERNLSAPYLRSFKVFPNTKDCRSYTLNKGDCIAPEKTQSWCAKRPELERSIWCTGENRFTLRFKEYFEPTDYAVKSYKENWILAEAAVIGNDYTGAPVTISCSKGRDAFIESRQEGKMSGKKLGRSCRVKFLIAEKVELEAKFDSHTPEDMVESARHVYEIGAGYWADMRRGVGNSQ